MRLPTGVVYYAAMLAPADRYVLVMWEHGGVEALKNDIYDIRPEYNAVDAEPVAQGMGAAPLRGLPAGEYLLSATAPRASASRFGLVVAAPRLPDRAPDLPGRNDSMTTAEDLGTVLGSRFVPGLSRSSDWQEAWYRFSTPRSQGPIDGLVTLMTDGQPMELSLHDDQGRPLSRARGNNLVRLDYAAAGGADSFFLKVGGRRGAYSLFFSDEA